jgi:hypothetical protein
MLGRKNDGGFSEGREKKWNIIGKNEKIKKKTM